MVIKWSWIEHLRSIETIFIVVGARSHLGHKITGAVVAVLLRKKPNNGG